MLKFFKQFPEVMVVMSEKEDGTMRLRDDGANMENRNKFFEKMGIDGRQVVGAKLENGLDAKIISDSKINIINEIDALVTKKKNIFLSITVADCVPIFFYEQQAKIIGIAHAGWRGVVGGIVKNTADKIKEIGGDAKNLKIALGPGTNSCHFEIKDDALNNFNNYKEYIINRDGKIFVDLKGILKKQLNQLGVKSENIENNNECTFCNGKLFSFRRDKPSAAKAMKGKPEVIEAMVAVIGMKNN